jgi:hypothetical protein
MNFRVRLSKTMQSAGQLGFGTVRRGAGSWFRNLGLCRSWRQLLTSAADGGRAADAEQVGDRSTATPT